MNRKYNLKLDLQFRCNNSIMKFNQFDNNTSDFFIKISSGGKSFDVEKAIVVLATIKPSGKVASQFVEVKNGLVYADLKPSMKDEIGTYAAQAMLILEDERVVTDVISYEVEEDKIFSLLNDIVETSEEFTLLTDMLSRLSNIEISEEQRVINEAERILSEENRKIEEAERVEAELIRQHEEADRAKYDATRESNENIRKQNESIRLTNETNRIDEETKRVEEENKRKLAEEERNANYNFMTEDEERRRIEANAHKEAEGLRAQAEITRVNEEIKRRTTEQARVSAENTRVNNENTREANETTRQTNETHRVEAETQRQNRYNSFIADAEANANNFENYTNSAKAKEEERKANELDRKSQEDRRISNEVERISNENTRKANEVAREKNETSRQNTFTNKVNEVDKKIIELNTTKDNFVSSINTKVDTKISELNTTKDNFISSINTKVDNKISELDTAKSDMTTTVSNKVNEVETRFNALTSSQQQDAEVIDARDGETSLKARLDRDIEKAKQVYVNVEGSHISTDSSVGYAKNIEILGNTIQSASNLADIRSVGDTVEGQELYEIPVLSVGKNLLNIEDTTQEYHGVTFNYSNQVITLSGTCTKNYTTSPLIPITNIMQNGKCYRLSSVGTDTEVVSTIRYMDGANKQWGNKVLWKSSCTDAVVYIQIQNSGKNCDGYKIQLQLEEVPNLDILETPYEPYVEDKLTILSPTPLEKVGDVGDRIICKDGVWGVEKNVIDKLFNGSENWALSGWAPQENTVAFKLQNIKNTNFGICDKFILNSTNSTIDTEAFNVDSVWSEISIRINKSKLSTQDVTGFKKWLSDNTVLVMYSDNTSQFIPLPYDQQIKLRTFANKTNISFGCEIEGTIKAQVPKSLGATVNTHTEQINNLNKELDRVKKLEESTVSTVTTESDFTTVEATSNGYFEDVKLEGKTLVNIHPKATPDFSVSDRDNPKYNVTKKEGYIKVTGSDLEATSYRYVNMGRINFEMFKPNTTYTLVFTKLKGAPKITLQNGNSQNPIVKTWFDAQDNKLAYTFVTTETLVKSAQILYLWVDAKSTTVDVEAENPMIFEGDLTANPPSGYIEGLKSVGQSATTSEDGADEIVVSSVNENLFDMSSKYEDAMILENGSKHNTRDWRLYDFIKVKPNGIYYLYDDGLNFYQFTIALYDSNKNFIGRIGRQGDVSKVYTMPSNAFYCRINYSVSVAGVSIVRNNIMFNEGTTPKPYTLYQSDKKRLLYYNEETQTWEKPILREGDSIEKHADGKYYYHQRSAEVVLNGSENWNNDKNSSTMSPETYRQSIQFNAIDIPSASFNTKTSPNIISDLLPTVIFGDVYSYNHIGISISGTDSIGTHIIINNNFIDVTELKQWLQTSNLTLVYQLAEEKVYECTNIDLITYANETNFIVESGALSPKTTLKVHSNISNVVSLLQKKVSLLESNVKASQEVQDMMILETDMRMLDIELALMEFIPMKLNLGGSNMLRSATYFNFLKNHIINETYEKEYLENVMNKYLATGRINQDEYDELYKMLYPPVYDIELPIEY